MTELQEPLFNNLFIWLILLAIPIIPNLWSIWHATFREFPSEAERLAWIGIGVFIPVLGGLIYLFVGRRRAARPGTYSSVPEQAAPGSTAPGTPEPKPADTDPEEKESTNSEQGK